MLPSLKFLALAIFYTSLVVALPSETRATHKSSLQVQLSGPKTTVHGTKDLIITVSAKNTGKETMKILLDPTCSLWTKPPTEVLAVEGPKGPARFDGVRIRGSTIEELAKTAGHKDVVNLKPGETHSVKHHLGNIYDLTESGAGKYKVHVIRRSFFVFEGKSDKVVEHDFENPVYEFTIDGALISSDLKKAEEEAEKYAKSLTKVKRGLQRRELRVNGCSADQEKVIREVAPAADKSALDAYNYVRELNKETKRWKYWFGTYDEEDRAYVTGVFERMTGFLKLKDHVYDCEECGKELKTYAYVYPSRLGRIFLCPKFWNAPMTGRYSQVGTLIHESTHYERIGGTNDYGGIDDAHRLVSANPVNKLLFWGKKAILNAENYAGFAENDPHLD